MSTRGVAAATDRARVAALVLACALPVVVGIGISRSPQLAVPVAAVCVVAIWIAVRRTLVWWDLLVLVVAGVYLLDYGFANIGLAGPTPIPVVDAIAILLVGYIVTRPGFRLPSSAPFLLAGIFFALTVIRVTVDYPTHQTLAIRDATLGVELAFLLIGYWALQTYGLERLVRFLSVVFLVAIPATALFPWREQIRDASPLVGLQHPVPLFGNFTGAAVVMSAAFFFFIIVRPYGNRSYALAAATLPLMALFQLRGLYVALPAAVVVVLAASRERIGRQIKRGLALTAVIGVVVLAVFFPFAPEGRLDNASPSFIFAQLATLSGREGPSSATVTVREDWFNTVVADVTASPRTLLFGVGLGPDLTAGFVARAVDQQEEDVLVRKPHNDYLEVFARYGLIGLVVFLALLGTAFVRVLSAARRREGLEGAFLWFAVAQSVVLGLLAATQPYLAFPWGTLPMFFVLGVALAVTERRPTS